MSSIYSSSSRASGKSILDTSVLKVWDDTKGVLFGVLYAMVKENSVSTYFMIASIIFEFFQMTIFCFRDAYHWGGINFSFDFNASMIGYSAYRIIFWFIVSTIILSTIISGYIGYTLHKGEIKSIYLLKILRWVVSLYLTVLFIPVLFVLFSGLACDYSTHPPSLLLYPTEPCWHDHTFLTIIAVVLVIIFSLSSLFTGLTYYEHDPNVQKACGRLQNRFEFASLLTKLILIIVTVFLMDSPLAYAIVSFSSSLFLLVGSIVTLPFYNHKLNLMRSGSYAGVLWVNIGMVVALALNDDSNIVPIIVATVGVPFACVAGAFAADRRFKYLCDPSLVDGGNEVEEMESIPAKKSKKKVAFDQPKMSKTIKNTLYSRLRFPWDVEIAARFILSEKPSTALIEKGKLVYQTGLTKFPNSPTVLQGYANFMFTIVGDWQLGYVILEKLRKMKSILDIQFFIYRFDKDRERRTEGGNDRIGDFIDFMEYKKLQQAARRHHSTSLMCIRKFWRYLLEPKVDVMELSALSRKIANAQKKAEEQYAKLVTNYPKNVAVLRDYAKFLDEVILDERAANEIRKKAEKYEQLEMESVTASHRTNSILQGQEQIPEETTSDHDSEIRSKDSETNDDDNGSLSSKSSGIRSGLVEAKLDKYNSLKKLGWIMIVTTAFALVVGIAELIVLNSLIRDYSNAVEAQNSAGGAAHGAMRVARNVADQFMIGARAMAGQNYSFSYLGPYEAMTADNQGSVVAFSNILRSLYWGTSDSTSFGSRRFLAIKAKDGFSAKLDMTDHIMDYSEFDHYLPHRKRVQDFFTTPRYNESILASTTAYSDARISNEVALWSLCNLFALTAMEITNLTLADFSKLQDHAVAFAYSLENSQEIAAGMQDVVEFYANNISSSLSLIMTTVLVIFLVATAILLVASITMFRPIVQKIFKSKVRTYTMFTLIPSSVVKIMSKKRISTTKDTESSGDEEEEEDIDSNDHEAKPKENPSNINFQAAVGDDARSDELSPNTGVVIHVNEANIDNIDEDDANKNSNKNNELTIDINNGDKDAQSTVQSIKFKLSAWKNLITKNKYNKVTTVEKEEVENDKKIHQHSKQSRLDVSSLKAVTKRLHFSYLIAILCIVLGLMISYLTIKSFLSSLVQIANDMVSSDMKTQYIQSLSMDISILTVYAFGSAVGKQYYGFGQSDMSKLWSNYNSMKAKSYQMDLLYDPGCIAINASNCLSPSSPYYEQTVNGFEYFFFNYYVLAQDILATYEKNQVTIDPYDPSYVKFRTMNELLLDGSETLTYLIYSNAREKIKSTKKFIAIITAVECVIFILIYLIIFRPFVKQLRTENDHTFSLIRMIPRKLLTNVPEIQAFINETLNNDVDED